MHNVKGEHFIAGKWVKGETVFYSDNPTTGQKNDFPIFHALPCMVDKAVAAATEAYSTYASTPPKARAEFLNTIADEIESRGEALTRIGTQETALPAARLEMERGRTVNQLRFFAQWIEEGSWLQARIDQADPNRSPLPKPDIRVVNKAIGPVCVFGASNFPLAFSTAGGDTASALAAGCPVVIRAHSAHPGTSDLVTQAIAAAIEKCNMPAGVFSQIQGGDRSIGQSLVAHPGIKAVGFTGSLSGGRALYDIATSRPEPIPFYGELGSNNPVFLMAGALSQNAHTIGEAWAQSLTMGVGQFCTNPGIIVAQRGNDLDQFKASALDVLKSVAPQAMLTARIAQCYSNATVMHTANDKVATLLSSPVEANSFTATPAVFQTDAKTWCANPNLSEEIFGPAAFIIECESEAEMAEVARSFCGQLTATLHVTDQDHETAQNLVNILEDKAGRILMNGFPTGVEVCHSMVHGGPYPASTDSRSTSVGSLAIQRFVRPVSYQGVPDDLLPTALQNKNPLGIQRLIDGRYTVEEI